MSKTWFTFLTFLLVPVFFLMPAQAMEPMAEPEMDEVTAGGFSSFSWDNGTATVNLDMEVRTWTEVGMFHAGPDPDGDQVWTDVDLGTQSTDLVLRDFVFKARFNNYNDPQNRELLGVKLGFQNVQGTVSANFQALSREGHGYRDSPGQHTYTFDGDPLMLHFNTEGDNPGVWVDFGDAT
ncbi:MAG: hypothetical protein K9K62_05985 [Desulfobacteraceae bacterium]|nr:hypothetical protein [Desulfobacteraceae bacterium]